jgi:hypothetical protein
MGQTQSLELTALHCERLAHLPITPWFVLNGRMTVERLKHVRGDDHWLVDPFKGILATGSGFPYVVCDVHF